MNRMRKIKNMLLAGILLVFAGSVSAEVVAAWHTPLDTDRAADVAMTGVDTAWGGDKNIDRWQSGSTDGTYGASLSGAPANIVGGRAFGLADSSGNSQHWGSFSVTNNTGSDLDLTTLSFDYGRWHATAPTNLRVRVYGDLTTTGTILYDLVDDGGNTNVVATGSDYYDVDLDLTTVLSADYTLADGERATFNFTVDGFGSDNLERIGVDNVALQAAGEQAVELQLDPSDVLTWVFSDAVSTGTVAVSYLEGSLATNVSISAISVVDQTHAGSFGNATALPLVLTDPSPSTASISIGFDNSAAGLLVGETATGVVEIVWNEVGETTSVTSSLPISATSAEVSADNIIVDFGFEDNSGDYPDAATSPWFTTSEQEVGSFKMSSNRKLSGEQAAVFQFYGDNGAIAQNLDVQAASNKNYEVSFWMHINSEEVSDTAAYTNAPVMRASIYSSPTPDGDYSFRKILFDVENSAENIWEKFSGLLTGPVMEAFAGEYIQIRLIKVNENVTHRIYLDNTSFAEYAATTPPSVLIGYYGANGTNDYHAAGIDGKAYKTKAYAVNEEAGSSDGTYGSTNGASLLKTGYEVRIGSDPVSNQTDTVVFTIENNIGETLRLDSISFDFGRFFAAGPTNLTLRYAWGSLAGIADGTVIQVATNTNVHGKFGDYDDYDWSLAGLADQVLGAGESCGFQLTVSGTTNVDASAGFDNIAIMGGAAGISAYDDWAVKYDLQQGADGHDDDDGLSNLAEYGVGGNPTNSADRGYVPITGTHEDGGTNWFEFVHAQRTTVGNGLTYSLEECTDLVAAAWTTNFYYVIAGESSPTNGFKSVTNWIPIEAGSQDFIRLMIGTE